MNKTEMLKKNFEFKYIFLKGNYISGKYIEMYIKKNNLNKNLLGISYNLGGYPVHQATLRRSVQLTAVGPTRNST